MTGEDLRNRRVLARIAGHFVAQRARISRGHLSQIECGHVSPSPEELARIETALDELIAAKRKVVAYAAQAGWPFEAHIVEGAETAV